MPNAVKQLRTREKRVIEGCQEKLEPEDHPECLHYLAKKAKEAQMGFRDDRAFPEYPDVACKAYLDYLDKKVILVHPVHPARIKAKTGHRDFPEETVYLEKWAKKEIRGPSDPPEDPLCLVYLEKRVLLDYLD